MALPKGPAIYRPRLARHQPLRLVLEHLVDVPIGLAYDSGAGTPVQVFLREEADIDAPTGDVQIRPMIANQLEQAACAFSLDAHGGMPTAS
jgi:hypothetical protein